MAYSPAYDTQNSMSGPNLNPGPDLDILVVGMYGAGKSATAKSILGEECVVTGSIRMLQKKVDGREMLVVDTPGPSDSELLDPERCREKAENNLRLAICLSPKGFHAILIVFRYGQRLTKEKIEEIEEIKNILGNDFMRDHGILIVTGGNHFENTLSRRKDFEKWCRKQEGYMQDLLQNCQNRCLLFNNRDKNVWKQQRFDLVQMIDGMENDKRYKRDILEVLEGNCHDTGDQGDSGNRFWNLWKDTFSWMYSSIASWQIFSSILCPFLTPELTKHNLLLVDKKTKRLEELKIAARGLKGGIKRKLDENIQKAECKLKKVEDGLATNP